MFGGTIIYDAQRQATLTLNSDQDLIQKHIMPVLVICKNKKDLNKMGKEHFSDAQWQLTP